MIEQVLTSVVRTVVPALWGAVVAWFVGVVPALAPLAGELNGLGALAVPVVIAVIIGAWYAFWRWLEPKLPDWLTRILLGSAKAPVYDSKVPTGNVVIHVPSNATAEEAARIVAESLDRIPGPDRRA